MPAKKPAEAPKPIEAPKPDPTWIAHRSKQGALDVALLGRVVRPGEPVKVSRAHADRLTQQELWVEVPAPVNDQNGA